MSSSDRPWSQRTLTMKASPSDLESLHDFLGKPQNHAFNTSDPATCDLLESYSVETEMFMMPLEHFQSFSPLLGCQDSEDFAFHTLVLDQRVGH